MNSRSTVWRRAWTIGMAVLALGSGARVHAQPAGDFRAKCRGICDGLRESAFPPSGMSWGRAAVVSTGR